MAVVVAIVSTGCHRNVVSGEVVDMMGEALPGVAVTVPGTVYQDVTDTLGLYDVRFDPAHIQLRYSKTGYTSAQQSLKPGSSGREKAGTVTLWNLPRNKGVFFLDGNRYHDIESVRPGTYGKFLGTEVSPQSFTTKTRPRIIAHRMPQAGAVLVRMDYFPVTVPQPDNTGGIYDIWAPRDVLPLTSVPIDMPEKLLIELKLENDLEPGAYAIHWGALDSPHPREPEIYFFSVEPEDSGRASNAAPPEENKADNAAESVPDTPAETHPSQEELSLPDLSDATP